MQQIGENGSPYVYFDGPGGTQVAQVVIDAMADYFKNANANCGGPFITSYRNDDMIVQARIAMADLLNAGSEKEIVFGANMTTLTFSFSRAIGRSLQPGDEIIVTNLDHDANISGQSLITFLQQNQTGCPGLCFQRSGHHQSHQNNCGYGTCGWRPGMGRCRTLCIPQGHRCSSH